jgi:tRNA nucleotidyltransferase (CCA-adding enzyme)
MNLAGKIEHYLPQHVLELVENTSRLACQSGQRLYLVGGVVRDLLLGYSNFDLDLVVEGNAVTLAQQIAGATQAKLVIHPRFGTAKLKYTDFTIDIATARDETYARPGALPTVTPGTLDNDLRRRDFSINAMAISLIPSSYGELIDPYHGKDDLERRLIRILHPKSFGDDATRILRAIRYEQRLGFNLETETARLLKENIPMLDTVSSDRIRHELELILREEYPEHALRRLGELGVLSRISPSLKGDDHLAENFEKARLLNKPSQLPSLYLCLTIYPLSQEENEQFLRRFNIPKKLARTLHDTLDLKTQLYLLHEPSLKRSEIYYLLKDYEPLAIQASAIASASEAVCRHLNLFLTELRYVKTYLSGDDLAKLGLPAGPQAGEMLEKLLQAKLDGEIKTEEEEEKLVLSIKTMKARSGRSEN